MDGMMDPKRVRSSQSSILYRFRDGRSIDELAEDLKTGKIEPSNVPPLRLTERDGQLFTLDNRRLEAFRRADKEIPWRWATADEIAQESFKFTTTNDGISVRVRGELT